MFELAAGIIGAEGAGGNDLATLLGQAVENIREAIALYLESLAAHDEPVPPPITEELVEVEA